MKAGKYLQPQEKMSSWMHGTTFRKHAFAQACTDRPGEPIELRVALFIGYDEFEPLNALGEKRGEKVLSGFYGAIGNLPKEVRFMHENMAVLMICEESVLKEYDPVRVFAGADPVTGEINGEDNKSLGAQLRYLFNGVKARVRPRTYTHADIHTRTFIHVAPRNQARICLISCLVTWPNIFRKVPLSEDDVTYSDVNLRIALTNMSMDFVAKTKMGPTPKSTSAPFLSNPFFSTSH